MAAVGTDDGSEDVADFLERIKELGDQRVKEDEERARKLEEEILQGRKERQARRAERARSISPTKDSPLASVSRQNTPNPASPSSMASGLPRPGNENERIMDINTSSSILEPSKPSPPPSSTLSRSGTLSWQQRPSPRGSPVRSRPLSMIATENAAMSPRATPEPALEDKELSMSEKARALESKDPSWFRQTADRGIGSAAYRRNQDSPEPQSGTIRLPGLSRESSIDPESTAAADRSNSRPISFHGSAGGTSMTSHAEATTLSGQSGASRSPFPTMAAQKFDAPPANAMTPSEDEKLPRAIAMSPSQSKLSSDRPERPVSPTKGLGGFVQSAMLKRSDSLSKRLSQQTPGLSRGNSAAGNKRSSSPVAKSTNLRNDSGNESPQVSASSNPKTETTVGSDRGSKDGEFSKPALPSRDSQRSEPGASSDHAKTIDMKRYSQTKPSWLENAINRPPSPVKMKPAVQKQPEWMENIAKAKQARAGSVDLKGTSHKEVAVGGFLRSPPMGASSPSPTHPASPQRSAASSFSRNFASSGTAQSGAKHGLPGSNTAEESLVNTIDDSKSEDTPASETNVTSPGIDGTQAKSPEPSRSSMRPPVKPKPETPPKTDFRSSLKSRQTSMDSKKDDVPEFKKAFGNLRSAETKNYVAPDELKDNIMRGKSALNITGGPKKTERVDEFKESILKKKSEFESGKSALITGNFLNKSSAEKDKPPVPEALAKKQLMSSRPGSVSQGSKAGETNPLSPTSPSKHGRGASEKDVAAIPEALARRQMMAAKRDSGSSTTQKSSAGVEDKSEEPTDDVASNNTVKDSVLRSGTRTVPIATSSAARPSPGGSSLAARFNPALAGIIGRGPSPGMAKAQSSSRPESQAEDGPTKPEPETVHMTKGRARGPKRRGAKAQAGGTVDAETVSPDTVSRASLAKPSSVSQPTEKDESASEPKTSQKPTVSAKPVAILNNAAEIKPQASSSSSVSVSKAPKTPPTTKPKRVPSNPVESKEQSLPQGLGISPVVSSTPEVKQSGLKTAKSPPVPGKKPNQSSPAIAQTSVSEPPTDAFSILQNFFKDTPGSVTGKIEVNTEAVISNPEDIPDKIRTKRREIWKITGDGKKISIPDEYNNMLFDEEMYLCTHVYHTSDWKEKTDVYLWCGDNVSPSEFQDALVFGRSAARSVNGTLIEVKQGKEPFNMFEALGGIIIVRFGNSSRLATAWNNYMLCGRNHMGQIAFDEVPFAKSTLCSGYPYLLCRDQGLTLWKGKGSTTPELSSALLTGNILGSLNGPAEIKEVNEGQETSAFWKMFSESDERPSSDIDWSLKPSSKNFRTRLFHVEARPKSAGSGFMSWGRRGSTPADDGSMDVNIKEVLPYAQHDLEKETITVLDTYFKVIVIVPSNATSKLASFRAALFFAQEYSMLAATLEDRPFIPTGVVELGSASEDLRTAFRKWVPSYAPLKKGKVSIDLKDALQAM